MFKVKDYVFKDDSLLKRALTHSSYGPENYERLEFLGDSILDFLVAKFYFKDKKYDEGTLTKMRSHTVSMDNLSQVFDTLKLGEYVRLGNVSYDDGKTPTTACESEMQAAGFPSSYWSGLCSLKEKHPNWTFRAVQTNLEWSVAVEKESACGKSLIQTSNSEYIDSSCSSREGSFRAASQKAVAFYMDPRNFLTEQYIFQFEYLKYDSALESSYTAAIDTMLRGASFYTYHLGLGTDFASLVTQAGKEMDFNPISLASRMRQEMGTGTSLYNLYSGVYPGYEGYYNFYNIGVNSSCVNNITSCGLNYAKNHGWYGPYNAIKGGADLLANGYLSNGQFNTYLQKFNVAPVNSNILISI